MPSLYTMNDVANCQNKKNGGTLLVIRGKVLDVEKFIPDHPGGAEILESVIGTDATERFDEIGHSVDAKRLMMTFQVGSLRTGLVQQEDLSENRHGTVEEKPASWWKLLIIPVVVVIATLIHRRVK